MGQRAILSGILASLAFQGPLHAAPPAGDVDPVARLRAQSLSAASAHTAGLVLEFGAGRYTLETGRLWRIEASDGRAIGLFFEGQGSFAWTADDANAARVYSENARRVGGFRAAKDRTLTAEFGQAAFYFSRAAQPALEATFSPEGATPASGLEALRRRFRNDRAPSPEFGAAAAGAQPYAEVLIAAGKDLRHVVDDAFAGEEALFVLGPLAFAPAGFPDWRFAVPVAVRPRGRSRREAPRPAIQLVDVDADVRETDRDRGLFDVRETLRFERAADGVALDLVSETLTSWSYSILPTTMTSVTGVDGRPLPYVLDKDRLFVFFDPAVRAGQTMKIRFGYDAGYFERDRGYDFWELPHASGWSRQPTPLQTRGAWFPQPVGTFVPGHTFHARVRARKPLIPFATGNVVRRTEDGDWNLVETLTSRPVRSATVLAGNYTIMEGTEGGVTCRVASYGWAKPEAGSRMLALFHTMRRFFETYFGRFPWKEYTIIDTPAFDPVGQASPGMARIPWSIDNFIYGGIFERLGSDVVHSWWGDSVWGAQPADRWIDEAFALAGAGRAVEVLGSEADFRRLRNIWRAHARDARSRAPIPLAGDVTEPLVHRKGSDIPEDRYHLLYFKGASLLEAIREETGDQVFFTVLQRFLASYEGSPEVTTDRFVAFLSEATKKDWSPWFEKYYYGLELP
jgi:hypothetical protein